MNPPAKPAMGLKLGSTLYSFTTEFIERRYSFEQLIAKVAELKLGPGLEMVGFQSIRGFPAVSDAFVTRFRELMEKYNLQPSCLAINADMAIRRGQIMTVEEAVLYHEPQLRAAALMGFPVVRCQFAAPPEVLRRLVPLAEKLEIKMGPEIHAPLGVNSPPVLAYREMYAKVNSPCLGFVPDFGSSARTIPPTYLEYLKAQGMPADILKLAVDIWHSDQDIRQKREEFSRRAAQAHTDPSAISSLAVIFGILSRQDARAWLDIMPQVIHIHGKCYDFDSAGNESSIPYDTLLPVFIHGGYSGYMSSEWEGHLYSKASGFDMVQKHQALCRRIIAEQRNDGSTA